MSFKHELQQQIVDLIKSVFYDETVIFAERNLLKEALAGISISDDNLYEYYKDNIVLKRDMLKMDQETLKELNKDFSRSKEEAKRLMETLFIDERSYSKDGGTTGFHRFVNFVPNIKWSYRFACNIKPDKIDSFVEHFLRAVFQWEVKCPNCGYHGTFSSWKGYRACSKCGQFPTFSFKIFHNTSVSTSDMPSSTDILRRDKITFYLLDKYAMKFVLLILKQLRHYFISDTPLLTKEIFPGLGCAVEPTLEDAANAKHVRIEEAKILSFGQWMMKIIIDDAIKCAKKHQGLLQEVLAYLNAGDTSDMRQRAEAFRRLSPFVQDLSMIVINDPRVQKHIQEMEQIHKEISDLKI